MANLTLSWLGSLLLRRSEIMAEHPKVRHIEYCENPHKIGKQGKIFWDEPI